MDHSAPPDTVCWIPCCQQMRMIVLRGRPARLRAQPGLLAFGPDSISAMDAALLLNALMAGEPKAPAGG